MWPFKKKIETRFLSMEQALGALFNTEANQIVNANSAESLPAVYCAVSTIADAVAAMPIHVYRKTTEGKERALTHHIERLLDIAPNDYQTPFEFKQTLMRAVLLHGNGYALVEYDGTGKPSELHNIPPTAITPVKLGTNRVGFKYVDQEGKEHSLNYEQVLHIKNSSDDGLLGRSPIQVCRDNLGLGLAMQQYGNKVLSNGSFIKGVLETDSTFKDVNAAKRLKDDWEKQFNGAGNAGKTPLLENGLTFKPVGMPNTDLQFLESRTFSIADIARIYKLSPMMLQELSNGSYSNFAESNRMFLSNTLRPWLTLLQQAFTKSLISERKQFQFIIEFNTKDILRASTQERFESYDIAIRNGIMSPNEARAAENMQSREGGDEYSQSWLNQLSGVPNETKE